MEERLVLLGRVAGGVAHDLNSYLTAVDVSLSLLYTRVEHPRQQQEVRLARDATRSALRLVATLVQYARGGAPAMTEVDLAEVVRRVVELFGRLIPSSVTVNVVVDGSPRPVRAVHSQLEQLVLNLLVNACDAMPRGGELSIRLRDAGDGATELEVADTGPGIPDAACRGANAESTKPGRAGLGLGLGIVHLVADHHRATVRVERCDVGTRAVVTFPPRE